ARIAGRLGRLFAGARIAGRLGRLFAGARIAGRLGRLFAGARIAGRERDRGIRGAVRLVAGGRALSPWLPARGTFAWWPAPVPRAAGSVALVAGVWCGAGVSGALPGRVER
ncbi:hypothetical protein ACWEGE_19795, partial [Amycolatopsis sp. NPDC004747]